MKKLNKNEQKLFDMLWALPYNHDPDNDIPNERDTCIAVIMVEAVESNRVDEFINIIESNPNADYDEMTNILLSDYAVEYVDEIDDDDKDFAD